MNKNNYFNHREVAKKWLKKWDTTRLYETKIKSTSNKFYNLWMFPYPSAEGLHAGHSFSSTGSDVIGRYMRMNGKNVFQPIGYDSFGIHSENYALKIKQQPSTMLVRTINNYTQQLKNMGHGYAWTHSLITSDADYYRWTQWLFTLMFKAGLAYRKEAPVNWCPSCKTVLADEQVIAGECERCQSTVSQKYLSQWFFKITDYADKLLENTKRISWSDRVIKAQVQWIGKKEGININYPVVDKQLAITCWTSRPDTNFGATFIVVAPEHKLIPDIVSAKYKGTVSEYIKIATKKSKEERIDEGREKTGVFTGSYALNQLTGKKMPIWISDFVLTDVGTGAVVGVPGHDLRDFEFAKKYRLPIVRVVVGPDGDTSPITQKTQVQENEGTIINSGFLNGHNIKEATKMINDYIESRGWGKRMNSYHLRDWLISRQRYWGPPIPMIYCESCAKAGKSWFTTQKAEEPNKLHGWHASRSLAWHSEGWYPEEKLPVKLPHLKDYQPKGTGRGPLAGHPEFYKVACPECGAVARRETDVSDTFLDSSWYFLAYPNTKSPEYQKGPSLKSQHSDSLSATPFNSKITHGWLPVDLYFGGAEHAVLHLMYARFVTQMLHDLGYLPFDEPFPRFFAHGLIIKDGAKMSKSRGNVVNPDRYIEKYGADTFRLYLMFLGPMDSTPDFRDSGIEGTRRFVDRVWNTYLGYQRSDQTSRPPQKDLEKITIKMHQTIKKVSNDIEHYRYNTAIAAIMEYFNLLRKYYDQENNPTVSPAVLKKPLEILCQLLAPFMPFITEEIWTAILRKPYSIHTSPWPSYNSDYSERKPLVIAVQLNGKLRSTLRIPASSLHDEKAIIKKAHRQEAVKRHLNTKKVIKTIYIPGKVINFVTR